MKRSFFRLGPSPEWVLSAGLATGAVLISGCTVNNNPGPPPAPDPVAAAPVVEGPGVEVITYEPAPEQRVYVYEPGYPPGTYYVVGDDNYYFYNGYRYPHEVFYTRYVVENVHEQRYVDVNENRRAGHDVEVRQRTEYVRTGGRPAVVQPRPQGRPVQPHERDERHPQ